MRGQVLPDWPNRQQQELAPGQVGKLQEVTLSHPPVPNKVGLGPEDGPQGVLHHPDTRGGLHLKRSASVQGEVKGRSPVNQPGVVEAGRDDEPVPGCA